jgi:phosphopantothenoylcysteine decarboxylase
MELTRVLICASGSVATLKVPEIAVELSKYELIDFRIVCSQASLHFIRNAEIYNPFVWSQFQSCGGMSLVFTDEEEWTIWQKIGDAVLHIELSQWADLVIVAPASADILAKINSGISDTLLLSILRAWNFQKPCILCPAMNTMMWEHPVTGNISVLWHSARCLLVE